MGTMFTKSQLGQQHCCFLAGIYQRPVEISWKGKQSWLDRRSTVYHWDQQEKTLQGNRGVPQPNGQHVDQKQKDN